MADTTQAFFGEMAVGTGALQSQFSTASDRSNRPTQPIMDRRESNSVEVAATQPGMNLKNAPTLRLAEIITLVVKSREAVHPLETAREKLLRLYRLSLIHDACVRFDYFFLELHFVFCMSTENIWNTQFMSDLQRQGLTMLQEPLASNQWLSKDAIILFQQMGPFQLLPMDLAFFYAPIQQSVGTFLATFGQKWTQFKVECGARDYPPLLNQIRLKFGLITPSLEEAMFRFILKHVFFNQVDDCFTLCLPHYLRGVAQVATWDQCYANGKPPTVHEVERFNQNLIGNYKWILGKHASHAINTASQPVGQGPSGSISANPQTTVQHAGAQPSTYDTTPSARAQAQRWQPIFAQPPPVMSSDSPVHFDWSLQIQSRHGQGITANRANIGHQPGLLPHVLPSNTPSGHNRTPSSVRWLPIIAREGERASTPKRSETYNKMIQAHLMDPILRVKTPLSQEKHYFQFFSAFALHPITVGPNELSACGNFEVENSTFERLAKDEIDLLGPPNRHVEAGSVIFRLRCIRDAGDARHTHWSIQETHWPSAPVAIVLNDKALEIRKAKNWGKDMPIDVQSFIRLGKNEVFIAMLNPEAPEPKDQITYSFAIEIIEINCMENITARIPTEPVDITTKHIADRTRAETQDPDLELLTSTPPVIRIPIIDPFSATLIETPVRSVSCRHYECFDLDTFLNTRVLTVASSTKSPFLICPPEKFRCPVCGVAAHPGALIKDAWMRSVVDAIKAMGEKGKEVREIIVSGGVGESVYWKLGEEKKQKENPAGIGEGIRSESDGLDDKVAVIVVKEKGPSVVVDLDSD